MWKLGHRGVNSLARGHNACQWQPDSEPGVLLYDQHPGQEWWLTPVISATWEVDIGGWRFEASLGKNLVPISKSKRGVMHTCNPSDMGGRGRRIMVLGWPWAKMQDPIWEITKAKRAVTVAQVVKRLPSKCEPWIQTPVLSKWGGRPATWVTVTSLPWSHACMWPVLGTLSLGVPRGCWDAVSSEMLDRVVSHRCLRPSLINCKVGLGSGAGSSGPELGQHILCEAPLSGQIG
jgi:hypothetical protein